MQITVKGLEELRKAVKKAPDLTRQLAGEFIVRGMALYESTVQNNPWRVGGSGGGAPVASGNLKSTHRKFVSPWQGTYGPTVKYAPYVHGIDGYPRKRTYQLRPWLNYSVEKNESKINELQVELMDKIVNGLAK